ncbi:hypothetical protein MNBD_ALPHA06-1767 [hydrothermal vent metagenome]|uniref:Uncharacterized protein n=1 Tax=hydrothermal vent metagenome TaxID=652676 RepID=A0A3B0R7N4_9ZZZZ
MQKILAIGLGLFVLLIVFGFMVIFKPPVDEPLMLSEPIPMPTPKTGNETIYADLLSLSQQLETLSRAHVETATKFPFAEPVKMAVYKAKFTEFSTMAITKASQIDQQNGPHDLACIFRGMAADSLHKLEKLQAAKTSGEQAQIWADAVYLFSDVRGVLLPSDEQTQPSQKYAGETCPMETVSH